jgi:hypothetical protein
MVWAGWDLFNGMERIWYCVEWSGGGMGWYGMVRGWYGMVWAGWDLFWLHGNLRDRPGILPEIALIKNEDNNRKCM